MEQKTNIFLTGKLGKKFGEKWSLFVKSPAEALHAININTKGALFEYLGGESAKKLYKVAVQKKKNLLREDELRNRTGTSDIYIMPTIRGKNSGWGKTIAGVVLVVVGAVLNVLSYGTAGSFFIKVGLALILGGVAQLLTPIPKISNANDAQRLSSSLFQGNAYSITQGGPVPVIYGRVLATPLPISISFFAQDKNSTYTYVNTSAVADNELNGTANVQYDTPIDYTQNIPNNPDPVYNDWPTLPDQNNGWPLLPRPLYQEN